MKKIFFLLLLCFFSTPALAQKHLIFVDGYLGWAYSMPPYMSTHRAEFEQLPFSGFSVVGDVYTSYVMSSDPNSNNITYERVWNEVKSLQHIFQKKENFLRINLDFPGDYWDDDVWQKTSSNFAAVARAAKNLGFKGIIFDDEAYAGGQHIFAHYMSNFKFPKKADVTAHPENYADWEINESRENRGDWVDYSCYINGIKEENSDRCAYRNPDYTFKEHMDKVASRFKDIMQAMEIEFPDITVLVFHGPASAHPQTNIGGHYIKPNGLFETNEYKGAMFLGLKQGLNNQARLHDLGEFYKYHTTQQFQDAYQWRKHDIVTRQYNFMLDDSFRWLIPEADTESWNKDVQVGFMVSDYARAHDWPGYNIEGQCNPPEVKARLTSALDRSDEYVVFYSDSSLSSCENDIRWADVETPVPPRWLDMVKDVYDGLKPKITQKPTQKPLAEFPQKAMPPIISLLLSGHSIQQLGQTVAKPVYNDPAGIAELDGAWYGAMGEHPVRQMSMPNPWNDYANDIEKNIFLFFPTDIDGKKPTVFLLAGFGGHDHEKYQALLYFIASQGFNAVYIPGPAGAELGNKNILLTVLDGVVEGPWSTMIDTTKIGYAGHSAGGSMVFYLAAERSDWGTQGRFIFSMASWWGYHLPHTATIDLPADTNMIIQVYHDDDETDPRQNIDFLLHSNVNEQRKTYLYIPGDANHASNHELPYTLLNSYDAIDQVGIYRPLESLMRYSFNAPMDGGTWKRIGLPDPGDDNYNTLYQTNGITVLSTDTPLDNHDIPIPAEEDLDQDFLCSNHVNERWEYCMPCGNSDRDQDWQQCQ